MISYIKIPYQLVVEKSSVELGTISFVSLKEINTE